MAVLRMIMFRPVGNTKAPHAKRLGNQSARINKSKTLKDSAAFQQSHKQQARSGEAEDAEKIKSLSKHSGSIQSIDAENSKQATIASAQSLDTQEWLDIIEQAKITGVVKALATHCALRSVEGNQINLLLAKEHESLMAGATVSKLSQHLKQVLGDDKEVSIEMITDLINSPAQQTRDREEQRLNQTQNSLEQDDFVQALKRDMQAEIVPGSIQVKQKGEI